MKPWLRLPAPSPATRVASGLVALAVALLLIVDVFTSFLPDRQREARRARTAISLLVATQMSMAFNTGGREEVAAVLTSTMLREPELKGGALRKEDGQLLAQVGNHAHAWQLPATGASTLDNVRTPILADGLPWGELQLVFPPAMPSSLMYWLRDPVLQAFALIVVLGFIVFQLYLRRVLRYLDPNSAVPERVRTAFDALGEGVLVLDPKGAVMLTNRAFQTLAPPGHETLSGLKASSLKWLVDGLPPAAELPWTLAMRENRPLLGLPLHVRGADGLPRELMMNCSPIDDGGGRVRGCLASFADVTELHERTERLRIALEALSASQDELEQKNQELTLQATRDPLTGSLNRRAFMGLADQRFAEAARDATPLCVVMCDIDHFKSINDLFGHALGDKVIQASVKSLSSGLRGDDILGRYGGEEFCILLPRTPLAQALHVAERLRKNVDDQVGAALRRPERPKVTMSFGVAEWSPSVADPATLIDLADQALYRSKQGGRNRVTA